MRKFEVVNKYLNSDIVIPKRATTSSAGYDLASAELITIKSKEIILIPTGLKVKMNSDETLFVFPRSSLGIKKKLMMSNSVGVVDADYYNNENNEGHLMIPIYNFGEETQVIEKNERIAQGVFLKYQTVVEEADNFKTRLGGFGSSDEK